jgi:hypothetical protein
VTEEGVKLYNFEDFKQLPLPGLWYRFVYSKDGEGREILRVFRSYGAVPKVDPKT